MLVICILQPPVLGIRNGRSAAPVGVLPWPLERFFAAFALAFISRFPRFSLLAVSSVSQTFVAPSSIWRQAQLVCNFVALPAFPTTNDVGCAQVGRTSSFPACTGFPSVKQWGMFVHKTTRSWRPRHPPISFPPSPVCGTEVFPTVRPYFFAIFCPTFFPIFTSAIFYRFAQAVARVLLWYPGGSPLRFALVPCFAPSPCGSVIECIYQKCQRW